MSKLKETTGRLNKKDKTAKPKITPIAIVGIGALFPGSTDACGYWRDILAGRDMITEIPPTHWLIDDCYDPDPLAPDKTYCKTGAFLSPIDFDPIEFGVPPTNLASTDTSQLLALIVAKQVLEKPTLAKVPCLLQWNKREQTPRL